MTARLLILIAAAAGLAVYLAMRTPAPVVEESAFDPTEELAFDPAEVGQDLKQIREQQTMLWERDLPGEEPAEPPDLDIQVEVDPTDKKNRLYYYINEAHGYYVESFEIDFYYKPDTDTELENSPLSFTHIVNDYLKANETYKGCLEVVPAELDDIGGDMGTDENWEARFVKYGRARTQNPDPLPSLARVVTCD